MGNQNKSGMEKTSEIIETIENSIARKFAKQGDLIIHSLSEHLSGPAKGYSTLILGKRTVDKGPGWKITKPILTILAPGHNYQLQQELSELPKGYKSLRAVFK